MECWSVGFKIITPLLQHSIRSAWLITACRAKCSKSWGFNDKGQTVMTANLAMGIFASVLCIGDSLILGSRAQGAETSQRIRIAYASRSSSAMPQYVAQTKGFFKLEGLETELIQMNPRLGATAVVNGDVSFATPFVSIFRGILQGFPIKLVFVHLKKAPTTLWFGPRSKTFSS
jgi:ABC-type nitrate/sulfonate/bicarbonate transport system substrate-binding protein